MKRLFICFLAVVVVDIANKNLYHLFEGEDVERVYWIGQSVSFLGYCVMVYLLARKINALTSSGYAFLLMVGSMNWIAFAVGDLIDEVTMTYQKSSLLEYGFFLLTIPYTVYLWKRRRLRVS